MDMFKLKAYSNIKCLCCCVLKVYVLLHLHFPYITTFLKVYLCCCILNFHIYAKTDGSKLGSFETVDG
jgi:hypothetical protein